jgi:hypothetical protein
MGFSRRFLERSQELDFVVGDWRVVNELDQESVRITEIERTGAISMGFGFLIEGNPIVSNAIGPHIDILSESNNETDVMDQLDSARFSSVGEFVKGQVIESGSGGEVNVVRVGCPFHLHPQNFTVEIPGFPHITDVESHMAKA